MDLNRATDANYKPENINIKNETPKNEVPVTYIGKYKKENRILEIVDQLKNNGWTNEQISQKITDGILKKSSMTSEIKGGSFISDRLRNNLTKKGIEIPNEAEFNEMIAKKEMNEGVLRTDEEKEIDRLFPPEKDISLSQKVEEIDIKELKEKKEMDEKGRALLKKFGEEKDEENKRWADDINRGQVVPKGKELPEEFDHEATARAVEKDMAERQSKKIYQSKTTVLEETPEGKFFNQSKENPNEKYDQNWSSNNLNADLEYTATKKLKQADKENLDTLLQMRSANDKIMFNNYLNGLYEEEQMVLLPILELREDTDPWITEWEKVKQSSGSKPKGWFDKLKDRFRK